LNDQTVFHEIDFDPRLVDPQELDDKVAHVLQGKLEAGTGTGVERTDRSIVQAEQEDSISKESSESLHEEQEQEATA
jgi:hypothetical protein